MVRAGLGRGGAGSRAGGRGLAHLGATVGPAQHTKADEDRVGQPHEDIVHTVHVHKLHAPALHVL